MKIIKISQSLGFQLVQKFDLIQKFDFNDFNNNSLKKTTELIKNNKQLEILIANAKSNGYKCLQEMLLTDIFPALNPYVKLYYDGKGKKMIKMLNTETIKKIDDYLFAFLNTLINNSSSYSYFKNPNDPEILVKLPTKGNKIDYHTYLESLRQLGK